MPKAAKKPAKPILDVSKNYNGELKHLGGSMSNGWNQVICNQVGNSLSPSADEEKRDEAWIAAMQAMNGIAPKDELEGMLAAQLVACHSASMECYRLAMHSQTLEWRRENLNQANKLSRTYTTLLESLNRHRGKGQQKVTVEHVHVHEGGQAIVGNVESPGGGFTSKSKEQPHAKPITNAPGQTMPRTDTPGDPVSVAGDAERTLPDARRNVSRGHRRGIRTPSSTGGIRQRQLNGAGRSRS